MANEKRLIDAYDAMRNAILLEGILAVPVFCIENVPTVDAVEVVRCRECKDYEAGYVRRDHGWCKEWGTAVRASGFCHHGERRADE